MTRWFLIASASAGCGLLIAHLTRHLYELNRELAQDGEEGLNLESGTLALKTEVLRIVMGDEWLDGRERVEWEKLMRDMLIQPEHSSL